MKNFIFWLVISAFFGLTACKSEYEKVRTSGDLEAILKKAEALYTAKDYVRAKPLYELVMPSLRGSARAEEVYFHFADCHYQLEEYVLSSYYFKTFANTYVNSTRREEAAYLSAYSHYLQSPSAALTQEESLTAIDELQLFTNMYPNSPKVESCNQLIDELRRKLEEKAFLEGNLYFQLKQYQSALVSFDNLLREYPESPDVERVRYLAARAAFELAENSILEKRADRYAEAIKRCRLFLEKFDKSKYRAEIETIKKSAEKSLGKYRGT